MSLLEEKLIEASANIRAQKSVCGLVSCAECGEQPRWIKQSPPPPFIYTKRGGVHVRDKGEVVVLPRIGGAQWSSTVGSTLWGTGDHGAERAAVLGVILGLAEIAMASWQLLWVAWWLL